MINFVLFLLLISPAGRNRELYKSMREAGFSAVIATALQLWVVGTTLFATAFFFRRMKKLDGVAGQALKNPPLDGVLLLAWWIVLVVACLYAFMMGMGG